MPVSEAPEPLNEVADSTPVPELKVSAEESVKSPAVVANGTRPEVSAEEVSAPVLTLLGVIAPSVKVIAGVVVGFATEPETPLAVTTETVVTVPPPMRVFISVRANLRSPPDTAVSYPTMNWVKDGEFACVKDEKFTPAILECLHLVARESQDWNEINQRHHVIRLGKVKHPAESTRAGVGVFAQCPRWVCILGES
jgi:hypothetical protein